MTRARELSDLPESLPGVPVSRWMTGAPIGTSAALTPDETAGFQAAVTYAKANGVPLIFGDRCYRITGSIDCGKDTANVNDGKVMRWVGDGRYATMLYVDLAEAYPAFDVVNQKRGRIENMIVQSTATSLHTCMFFLAESTASGANVFTFANAEIQDLGASSKMAIFGYTADQCVFELCNVMAAGANALAGAYFGANNPGGITSKFASANRVIAAYPADQTLLGGEFSNFLCGTGPGLWVQDYTCVNIPNCYGGVIGQGGHAKGTLRFGSPARSVMVNAPGVRVEENSTDAATPYAVVTGSIAPTGDGMTSTLTTTAVTSGALAVGMLITGTNVLANTVIVENIDANNWKVSQVQTVASTTITSKRYSSPAVYVEDHIYNSKFEGQLSGFGGALGGPGIYENCVVSAQVTSTCFASKPSIVGGIYYFIGGANSLGYLNVATSRQFRIGGRIGTAANTGLTLAQCAATVTGYANDGNNYPAVMNAQTAALFPSAGAPAGYRFSTRGDIGGLTYSAYTGGSVGTLAQIASKTIQLGSMAWFGANNSIMTFPKQTIKIKGQFNSSWAAGGQVSVRITQTVTGDPTPKDTGALTLTGIPAYGAAVGFAIELEMVRISSTVWSLFWKISTEGSAPVSNSGRYTMSSGGFSTTDTAPATVAVSILNSGTTPFDVNGYLSVE